MSEKCACHIRLPDGTIIALKDSVARELILGLDSAINRTNSGLTSVKNDVKELETEKDNLYKNYNNCIKDINNINTDLSLFKSGLASASTELREGLASVKAELREDIHLAKTELREDIDNSVDLINSSLKCKLIDFKNTVNMSETKIKWFDVKPFSYMDIGFTYDSYQQAVEIVRIPMMISRFNKVMQFEIEKEYQCQCYNKTQLSAKLHIKLTPSDNGDGTCHYELKINLISGTVSNIRVENIIVYYVD